MKKYIVNFTKEERAEVKKIGSSGKHSAQKIRRARVLLKADEGWTDERISKAIDISIPQIERIRKQFVEEPFKDVLNGRKSKRIYKRKLDGKQEAQLIALACSESPEGTTRWTLKMLANKMVQLEYVDSLSADTVRRTLKKTK